MQSIGHPSSHMQDLFPYLSEPTLSHHSHVSLSTVRACISHWPLSLLGEDQDKDPSKAVKCCRFAGSIFTSREAVRSTWMQVGDLGITAYDQLHTAREPSLNSDLVLFRQENKSHSSSFQHDERPAQARRHAFPLRSAGAL